MRKIMSTVLSVRTELLTLRDSESRGTFFLAIFEVFGMIAVAHAIVHAYPAYVSRATVTTFDCVTIAISLTALISGLVNGAIHQRLLERAKSRTVHR